MAGFDPYLKWLGIRDPQRPPDHYRLLGVERFEADPDVISMAADRQMSHVRTFQNGPDGERSQTLLNELAEARRCLLNPPQRAEYERELRANPGTPQYEASDLQPPIAKPVKRSAVPPAIPTAQPKAQQTDAPPSDSFQLQADHSAGAQRRARRRASGFPGQVIGIVAGGLAAVGVGALIIQSGWLDSLRGKTAVNDPAPQTESPAGSTPGNGSPQASDTEPGGNSGGPQANRPQGRRPNRRPGPGSERNPARNGSNTAANRGQGPVWESARWPNPPESILRPKSTRDRLLQPCRIALAQRDFVAARNAWAKVRAELRATDPGFDMARQIDERERFWKAVGEQSMKLKIGQELSFRGQPVKIMAIGKSSIDLKSNQAIKTFSLLPDQLDRDLAAAIAIGSGQFSPQVVERQLVGDFAHFDWIPVQPTTKPSSVANSPKGNGKPVKPAPVEPTVRSPVPSKPVLNRTVRQIKETFSDAYQRGSTRAVRVQAAKRMQTAAGTSDSKDEKYGLLHESLELAKSAGETDEALSALESIEAAYEVNYWKLALETVAELERSVFDRKSARALYDGLTRLARTAARSGQIESAIEFMNRAKQLARKANDAEAEAAAESHRLDYREIGRLTSRGKQAIETLKSDDSNAQTVQAAGDYLGFVLEQYAEAGPYWALGGTSELASIAAMEREHTPESTADQKLAIADAWFEIGKTAEGFVEKQALRRARTWYQRAKEKQPDLGGLRLTEVDQRLKTIAALADEPAEEDDLSPAELEAALFANRWMFESGTPNEFQIQFARNRSAQLILSTGNQRVTWQRQGLIYQFRVGNQWRFEASMKSPTELVVRQIELNTNRLLYSGIGTPRG